MLKPLCTLLITTLCCQYASSRHLGQQPYYTPYSDYSYTYSGPGPLYHQQQHSPFFSPPGTYFDQRQGILRPFPGGGVPVLVDYHKRCSNQYVGLKPHPDQHQYYYVCKPDCVIFGKCQNLQIFNATCGQCVQHPAPEYKPICTEVGRFPLFSDCHLYYKCEEDLKPKIYSCPSSMVFSPVSKKCIDGYKCTPTQISPHSTYISDVCASKFPPCFENGIFRSPSDCSLYYKCDLKSNGIYMQTRLKCPQDHFYDLQKKECLPAKQVPCDCIQVAELVYPKPNAMHFQPPVYPAQFEIDSLEEGYYPVEQSKDESNNRNSSGSSNDAIFEKAVTTTLAPSILKTTLNEDEVEQNDVESAVLSDYIDMGEEDNKSFSKELEPLTQNTLSSEETDSLPADSEETGNISHNEGENSVSNVTENNGNTAETVNTDEASTEEIDELDNIIEHTESTATEELSEDMEINKKAATTVPSMDVAQTEETVTNEPSTRRSEIETTASAIEQEQKEDIASTRGRDVEITAATKDMGQEKETSTAKVSTRSIKSQPCENDAELDADTHTKNTAQTQTSKCLPKLTTNTSNIDLEPTKITISENTADFRNKLHEHNSTNFTTVNTTPNTTHLATSKITPASDNLVENQLPQEITLDPDRNSSQSDLLDSQKLLMETVPKIKEPIHSLEHDLGETEKENVKQANAMDDAHTRPIERNAIEGDVSFDEFSNTGTNKNQTTAVMNSKKSLKEKELNHKIDETTENFKSSPILLRKKQLQVKETQTTTNKTVQATTVKTDSATINEKKLGSTGSPVSDEITTLLDSDIKINNFETSKKTEESVAADIVDFSAEEFLPVHSKSATINELPKETADYENRFDDDYTTIISEKEFTTTAATPTNKTAQPEGPRRVKETTLKRRQAIKEPTPATVTANDTEQFKATAKIEKNVAVEGLHGQSEGVSNNEITSAANTSNSKPQEFSHTHLRTSTPTQKTTATPKITTTEPSEHERDHFTVHVRKTDEKHPAPNSPPIQSLYYTLETAPVINNNKSNNNETVTASTPGNKSDNGNIPRLEIIAERPIDVHLSICPPNCDTNHTHNNDSSVGKRAVLLKWFANKSKQTMGFETANEPSTDDERD